MGGITAFNKVKMFHGSANTVERQANEWLESIDPKLISINDVKMALGKETCLLFYYREAILNPDTTSENKEKQT